MSNTIISNPQRDQYGRTYRNINQAGSGRLVGRLTNLPKGAHFMGRYMITDLRYFPVDPVYTDSLKAAREIADALGLPE